MRKKYTGNAPQKCTSTALVAPHTIMYILPNKKHKWWTY